MSDDKPAIAVVPYGKWPSFGISRLSLDALEWPLGRPDRLAHGTVRDLTPNDHLLTFPRSSVFYLPWRGVRAKVSVMIVEPDSIHGHHLRNAYRCRHRFHRILTRNRPLLARLRNGVFFVLGFTFIENRETLDRTKTRICSLIASKRDDLPGHKMRHRIVDHIRSETLDVDVMGRGYKPFADKAEGLAPYRYSVVIENSAEDSYFTEKLIDALLCDTVPIYWGAPDIAEHFDPAGMVICTSQADIETALTEMSEQDYETRKPAIAENRKRAERYADYYRHAAQTLLDAS